MARLWEYGDRYHQKRMYEGPDASEKYQDNPKDYSRQPVAICPCEGNCHAKEGRFCFSKRNCTAKRELDGSGRMLASEAAMFDDVLAGATKLRKEAEKKGK